MLQITKKFKSSGFKRKKLCSNWKINNHNTNECHISKDKPNKPKIETKHLNFYQFPIMNTELRSTINQLEVFHE